MIVCELYGEAGHWHWASHESWFKESSYKISQGWWQSSPRLVPDRFSPQPLLPQPRVWEPSCWHKARMRRCSSSKWTSKWASSFVREEAPCRVFSTWKMYQKRINNFILSKSLCFLTWPLNSSFETNARWLVLLPSRYFSGRAPFVASPSPSFCPAPPQAHAALVRHRSRGSTGELLWVENMFFNIYIYILLHIFC